MAVVTGGVRASPPALFLLSVDGDDPMLGGVVVSTTTVVPSLVADVVAVVVADVDVSFAMLMLLLMLVKISESSKIPIKMDCTCVGLWLDFAPSEFCRSNQPMNE